MRHDPRVDLGRANMAGSHVDHRSLNGRDASLLEAHLAWWMREIADLRRHGTTGEPPLERFRRRDEATALRPLTGRSWPA
jgi:hypothetical protein